MAELTRAAFLSKWQSRFADNITREISEADVREFTEDIKDSFINSLEFSPSSSFGGLTGEVVDSQKLVQWGNGLISTVRGGVGVDYNTLNKLYLAVSQGDFRFRNGKLSIANFGGISFIATGVNNYVVSPPFSIGSGTHYTQKYIIEFQNANTGDSTLKIDTSPVSLLLREDGTALQSGDIQPGSIKLISRNFANNAWIIVGLKHPLRVNGGTPAARTTEINARGGTAAQWESSNPILGLNELGIETDAKKAKVGDGITPYNSLPYWFDSSGTTAFKGFYVDDAAIIAAYPAGNIGDYAVNGFTDTFWIWDADTSAWVDSGQSSPTILIDSVAVDGSTNAAQSGDVYTKYSYLSDLISALQADLTAIESSIPEIEPKVWVPYTPVAGAVTIDFSEKQEAYAEFTAASDISLAFTGLTTIGSSEVVEFTADITFNGITSLTITPPAGDNFDDEGTAISVSNSITFSGVDGGKYKIYALRNSSGWAWWWPKTQIIDGGTT